MSVGIEAGIRAAEQIHSGNWYAYSIPDVPRNSQLCMQGFDFEADDWYFHEYAPKKEQHVKCVHIHFSENAGQQQRLLIKQYAAWRLGRVRPVTVRLELNTRLCHWLRYLRVRKIKDPALFGAKELERFAKWLYMQDVKEQARVRILHTIVDLIQTGQRLNWRVTREKLPQDLLCPRVVWSTDGATAPIPKHIYDRILAHVKNDETDEITRAGIIIQSQTGLRISEVLSLKNDCIITDGKGRKWLIYRLKKTTKAEPEQRRVPANPVICEAIERLREATESLREESGREELFLVRNHGIRPASQNNWNKGRLHNFLCRWKITDEQGEIYQLHSHQFRATYVSEQILGGGQIEQIQHQLGHVSPEMTVRYVHLPEEAVIDALMPCISGVGR